MRYYLPMLLLFISFCTNGTEPSKTYTGSTPAHPVVRHFLGISLSDSIDFIRWKLTVTDNNYTIQCNYGIGKPNTSGFINSGKWVNMNGKLKKERDYFFFEHSNKTLVIAELNNDLLHLLDNNKNLLVGTAGWSYTLSNEKPLHTDQINMASKKTMLNDSMVFQGRTPCIEYENVKHKSDCYKLKWYIVLYADTKTKQPAAYSLRGTVIDHKTKKGTWTINTSNEGKTIVHLLSENKQSLYFLMPDENILLFTDAEGKLLVGDKDFSYTLNRKI